MKFRTKVVRKRILNEKIIEVCLEKPENFEFRPGQWITLKLLGLEENVEGGNKRAFSITSSPLDKEICLIIERGISPYKRYLEEKLSVNEEVEILGPFGNLIFDENAEVSIFLVAGSGIAPILSMIRYSIQKNLKNSLYLFYSEKYFKFLVYLEELLEYSNSKKLNLVITLTQEKLENFEHGRINKDLILKYVPEKDLRKAIFYIVGSSEFVKNMLSILEELKIEKSRIKTEGFG